MKIAIGDKTIHSLADVLRRRQQALQKEDWETAKKEELQLYHTWEKCLETYRMPIWYVNKLFVFMKKLDEAIRK